MSTTQSTHKRGTDSDHQRARCERDPLVERHAHVGVDADGYVHHLDRDERVVHRIDIETGARERVSDLGAWLAERSHSELGNAVDAYVHDYIGSEVGWDDRNPTNRDVFGGVA